VTRVGHRVAVPVDSPAVARAVARRRDPRHRRAVVGRAVRCGRVAVAVRAATVAPAVPAAVAVNVVAVNAAVVAVMSTVEAAAIATSIRDCSGVT
jgi:hypothetical protein